MSLSEDVRGELAAIEPRKPCCRLAELSALVRSAGSVHLRGGGRIGAHLDLASPAVARRAFSLLRGYGVVCEIRTFRQQAFVKAARYQLHIGDDARAMQVLNEAGILGERLAPLDNPPRRVVGDSCCRAAYLRGALLARGSVSGPRNAHFELRTSSVGAARFLARIADSDGLALAVHDRGRHAIAYAKGAESIADLLAFLGAQEAALRFGESAVVSATRGHANRLANADHANLKRSSRAANAQLRAIKRLDATRGLESLSPDLRQLAKLRLRHPTLSLTELARRCRPPVTKASAHRRLRKLQELADH